MITKVRIDSSIRFFLYILPVIVIAIMYLQGKFSVTATFIVIAICTWISSLRLKLEISNDTIHYKLLGWHLKTNTIPAHEIDEIKVVDIDPLSDFLGWGIRWSPSYGLSYILSSGSALYIKTKSGKKRTFSIGDDKDFSEKLKNFSKAPH